MHITLHVFCMAFVSSHKHWTLQLIFLFHDPWRSVGLWRQVRMVSLPLDRAGLGSCALIQPVFWMSPMPPPPDKLWVLRMCSGNITVPVLPTHKLASFQVLTLGSRPAFLPGILAAPCQGLFFRGCHAQALVVSLPSPLPAPAPADGVQGDTWK